MFPPGPKRNGEKTVLIAVVLVTNTRTCSTPRSSLTRRLDHVLCPTRCRRENHSVRACRTRGWWRSPHHDSWVAICTAHAPAKKNYGFQLVVGETLSLEEKSYIYNILGGMMNLRSQKLRLSWVSACTEVSAYPGTPSTRHRSYDAECLKHTPTGRISSSGIIVQRVEVSQGAGDNTQPRA